MSFNEIRESLLGADINKGLQVSSSLSKSSRVDVLEVDNRIKLQTPRPTKVFSHPVS